MTLKEVIDFVDAVRENDYSADMKTQWVNDVETMIQAEVLLFSPADTITYKYSLDSNCELLVGKPYEKLYYSYLMAMVAMANGEYDRYQNEIKLFNGFYMSFCKWFADHYDPATCQMELARHHQCIGTSNSRGFPVYLSAYAIDVRHGFVGDEKAWLRSLRGKCGKCAGIGAEWLIKNLM